MYVVADDPLINSHSSQPTLATRATAAIEALGRTLHLWRARARERDALTLIDERDLHDLSLSRYDVQRELAKPFWRG
jgi:uncharacterized protein YjiS (DUF1127 family)